MNREERKALIHRQLMTHQNQVFLFGAYVQNKEILPLYTIQLKILLQINSLNPSKCNFSAGLVK